MLYGLIIGAVSNIIFNFILIPRYQIWGAAIATLCSEGVFSGIELFWGRDIIDLKKVARYFLIYLSNSLIMGLFVFIILKIIPGLWTSTVVAICVGTTIYGVLLILEKNHFVMDFVKVIRNRL